MSAAVAAAAGVVKVVVDAFDVVGRRRHRLNDVARRCRRLSGETVDEDHQARKAVKTNFQPHPEVTRHYLDGTSRSGVRSPNLVEQNQIQRPSVTFPV